MHNWYCIYTKPGQEDGVVKKLGELPGLYAFNPKLKRKKYSRAKLIDAVEALFPGYIFAKFKLSEFFHMITYTRGVKRFVGDSSGVPYQVDESIIDFIHSQMQDGFIHLKPPQFSRGQEVTVKDGPFSGLTGILLEEIKPSERVIILLNTIRYQAKIEIPKDFVDPSSLGSKRSW